MTLPSWSVRVKVRVAGAVTVSIISRKDGSGERLAHTPGDWLPVSGRPLPSKAWALGLVLLPPSGQERNNWPSILGHLHALCHLSQRNQSTKPRCSHYISFLFFFVNYCFCFSITVFITLLELKFLVTVVTTWGGSRRGDWASVARELAGNASPRVLPASHQIGTRRSRPADPGASGAGGPRHTLMSRGPRPVPDQLPENGRASGRPLSSSSTTHWTGVAETISLPGCGIRVGLSREETPPQC